MGIINNFLKGSYQKYAKGYAEELFQVLGNEEGIKRVITSRNIDCEGNRELVFQELYKLLDKQDAKILKSEYLDIVKIGEFSVLWEGFGHFEEKRKKLLKEIEDDRKEGIILNLIIQADEGGMGLEELVYRLRLRMLENQKTIPLIETSETQSEKNEQQKQEEPKVVNIKKEEPTKKEEQVKQTREQRHQQSPVQETSQKEEEQTKNPQTTAETTEPMPSSIEDIKTGPVDSLEGFDDAIKEKGTKKEQESTKKQPVQHDSHDSYMNSLMGMEPPAEDLNQNESYLMD